MLKGKSFSDYRILYRTVPSMQPDNLCSTSFYHEQLRLRHEYEKIKREYLIAKEKNEELLKELQSMKESQEGFQIDTSHSFYDWTTIMKTNIRIFHHHQKSSLMLLFRLMVSREPMGPHKQTVPKEKISMSKYAY